MRNLPSNKDTIVNCLKGKPVITTLVHEDDLGGILQTSARIVCMMKTDLFALSTIVDRIKAAGKLAFVHFDLVEGLGKDEVGVAYVAKIIGVDGIVTTKNFIISEAQKQGLITVQRLFVFDSVSLENGIKMAKASKPDAIEVLPGMVCAKFVKRLRQESKLPVIAGGLMMGMDDLDMALEGGAIGISTSSKELWHWQDANADEGSKV